MIPAMPGMRSEVGRQTIKAGPVDMTKSNDQIESGMSTGRGSPLNADKLCIYPIEFLAHAIRAFTAKPGFAARFAEDVFLWISNGAGKGRCPSRIKLTPAQNFNR